MPLSSEELIVCGWNEVFIYNMQDLVDGVPTIVWRWDGKHSAQLPEHMRNLFRTTDDCKPIEDGNKILITSSAGAVAIVERESAAVSFYARAANAHSAEMLPNGRLIVASSLSDVGNKLIVFDLNKSDTPISSVAMPSAHGVVWDAKRACLWGLGFGELKCYTLSNWESSHPSLECIQVYELPYENGHDLSQMPDSDDLLITAAQSVSLFNKETGTFSDYQPLAGMEHVKGIAIHPETAQLAYVQAEGDNWWAEHIHFKGPAGKIHIPGEHFYKVRWNCG